MHFLFLFAESASTSDVMLSILAIIMIIIFWGSIYAFVLTIFMFVFSKGNDEKIKKAWNNIRYMILWLIFVILLLIVFPIAAKILNIPWAESYTAKNIYDKSKEIIWLIMNPNSNNKSSNINWQINSNKTYKDIKF